MKARRERRQCAKCPWKKSTDPHAIPDGYCEAKHLALADTIAPQNPMPEQIAASLMGPLKIFACHDSKPGRELACVGWLVNQLGPGNNIPLRIAVRSGRVSARVRTVGPQHERFEDTLPRDRRFE